LKDNLDRIDTHRIDFNATGKVGSV
jgi:hypothetical protein